MNIEKLLSARNLLEEPTPLSSDCGALCAAACCAPDEDGQGGMILMPGEAELIAAEPWAKLGEGGLIHCGGQCRRAHRPFACRIFPLAPALRKDGSFSVRMDRRALPVCPLAEHGVRGLSPAFVARAREAVALLASDPEGAEALREWARLEKQYAKDMEGLRALFG